MSNTINYQPNIIEAINEEQALGFYKLYGNLLFIDSFFTNTELSVSFLHDRFESNEINIELDANFSFPIDKLIWNANDLKLGFNTNYYATSFKNEYNKIGKSDFGFLTAQLHPSYQFDYKNFNIYAGVKGTFLMDSKRNKNYFLVYPDVKISYALQKDKTNIYAGVTGELAHHSYKSLTDENPFLSPTLNLHPTNNPYNAFAGLKGNFNKTVNYNIKGSYAYEQSKPLFITNNSKSDGTTIGPVDSENDYFGYEYGNSHQVIYDNIKTISVFSELEYQAFKEFIIGISATYNKYTLKYEQHPWHLPTIKGELFGKYKQKKWHASANIYYVGERKGVTYSGIYTTRPSSYQPINLKGYFDVNIGATYHFNPILSAFVKGKNLTNGSYQQYHNFNSQGFQIVGGIIWKFDSLF